MKKDTVWLIVDFAIGEGKLDAFSRIAEAMAAGSEQEPGTLTYQFCLSPDRRSCRLIEAYVDADALLAHLTGPVIRDLAPRLMEVVTPTSAAAYGEPGLQAREILASLDARVFERWHGFSR